VYRERGNAVKKGQLASRVEYQTDPPEEACLSPAGFFLFKLTLFGIQVSERGQSSARRAVAMKRRPTKFELVISLKTAKHSTSTFRRHGLACADEVIE
jgi:uncharacterized protein with WD repeat